MYKQNSYYESKRKEGDNGNFENGKSQSLFDLGQPRVQPIRLQRYNGGHGYNVAPAKTDWSFPQHYLANNYSGLTLQKSANFSWNKNNEYTSQYSQFKNAQITPSIRSPPSAPSFVKRNEILDDWKQKIKGFYHSKDSLD